jgi:hypothetical protein
MDAIIQKGFVQELPYGVPIERALDSGMKYLTTIIPRVTNWGEIIFTPAPKYFTHQIFLFSEGKDAFIGFLVSQKATFLPDLISQIIQIYGGINISDDALMLVFMQRWIHDFLWIFIELCSLRLAISVWLIINPYTMPWFLLLTATEWFTESLNGIFPAFFGIEMTGTALIFLLSNIADYIKNIVFTMPYLPSERVAEVIGNHEVYKFGGIPKLWYQYGIPDKLREEWFQERPDIIENLIRYYRDSGIDFVPSRVLEQFYNSQANLTNSTIDFISSNIVSYDFTNHQFVYHLF